MDTTVDGLITINEMGVIETANPAAALTARYQAMADWYTSAPADARIARYQAMADWYTKQ